MVRNLLTRLLEEIEHAGEPLPHRRLAERLGVESSALDGMLRTLEQKRLVVVAEAGPVICSTACRAGCAGMASCPFVASLPEPVPIRAVSLRPRASEGQP